LRRRAILSVDDNEDDNFLLKRAFGKSGADLELRIAGDGQAAIEYLSRADEMDGREDVVWPDLVLLDLKMPRKDGFAVLDWLRQQQLARSVRVAVFTSSQSSNDINRAYGKGAEWYLVKPVALEDLVQLARDVVNWMETGDALCLTKSPYYHPRNLTIERPV
jgi:CheY-like chemotaxis protein